VKLLSKIGVAPLVWECDGRICRANRYSVGQAIVIVCAVVGYKAGFRLMYIPLLGETAIRRQSWRKAIKSM